MIYTSTFFHKNKYEFSHLVHDKKLSCARIGSSRGGIHSNVYIPENFFHLTFFKNYNCELNYFNITLLIFACNY